MVGETGPGRSAAACADAALKAFLVLQRAEFVVGGSGRNERAAAVTLVEAVLALMKTFPEQGRADFATVLPLTRLELALLRSAGAADAADALTDRLSEWATRSPVVVDEANVHASDFLAKLEPFLDLWEQREDAARAAQRLVAV